MRISSLCRIGLATVFTIVLQGCGDGNSSNNITPPPAPPPPPAPNTTDLDAGLVANQIVGGSSEIGTAQAALVFNLDDLVVNGDVVLTGVSAAAVSLRQGFAGEAGGAVVDFEQDTANRWTIPTDSGLTAADIDALAAGGLYLRLDTDAAPQGALRGQLLPAAIQLLLVRMSANQAVPPLVSTGSATTAVTYDPTNSTLVAHLNAAGLDDAVAAHIHGALAGTTGGVLIELVQDPGDVGHWFSEDASLDAAGEAAFAAGGLYVNLHTPANPAGEVRGQIAPVGIEVLFTGLAGGDVVPPSGSVNDGVAATTINTDTHLVTININLNGLDDAASVTVIRRHWVRTAQRSSALVRV